MDTCIRLYVTKYDITNFPFNRALTLWRLDFERRGEYNITNVSNELDTEHNVLEAHNDIQSTEVHVHMQKVRVEMGIENLISHKTGEGLPYIKLNLHFS